MNLESIGYPTCCNCGSRHELNEYKNTEYDDDDTRYFYCSEYSENCDDFNVGEEE